MSLHRCTDTASPNHWWAFSCTITDRLAPARKKPRVYTGRVWFSSAKPKSTDGTTPPWASNGKAPNRVDSQASTSGVRSTLATAASWLAPMLAPYAVITGEPSGPVAERMSYLPMAMNVRYVACGLVLRQFHRVCPSRLLELTSTPLDTTWVPSGTATDTS